MNNFTPRWVYQPVAEISHASRVKAENHQSQLTKPRGALGLLEILAIRFAGYQCTPHPQIDNIAIRVFVGDHGICAQHLSAYPQIVTTQMIENFVRGGAAISVLAKNIGADFKVVNMGTANPLISAAEVCDRFIAAGTQDFSLGPAMSPQQAAKALAVGRDIHMETDLFIGGEMGIGNTTAASALYCALLNLSPEEAVGPGSGVDEVTVKRKAQVIATGLKKNNIKQQHGFEILCCLGGFEIAALVGAYISAAQQGIPSLVDGFITTAAALLACKLNPAVKDWLIFSHLSAEPAHRVALEALEVQPLLNIGMRLGEGSGAAVAVPLVRSALLLHNQMATFSRAGVSKH